jgi:hypothetical protein
MLCYFLMGSTAEFASNVAVSSRSALFASIANTFISWMIRLFYVYEQSRSDYSNGIWDR